MAWLHCAPPHPQVHQQWCFFWGFQAVLCRTQSQPQLTPPLHSLEAASAQWASALSPGLSLISNSQSQPVPTGSHLGLGISGTLHCQFLLVLSAKQLVISPLSLRSSASVPADFSLEKRHPSLRVPFFLCYSLPAGPVLH